MLMQASSDVSSNPIRSQFDKGTLALFCHCWLSNYILITWSVNTIWFLRCNFLIDEDKMIL